MVQNKADKCGQMHKMHLQRVGKGEYGNKKNIDAHWFPKNAHINVSLSKRRFVLSDFHYNGAGLLCQATNKKEPGAIFPALCSMELRK